MHSLSTQDAQSSCLKANDEHCNNEEDDSQYDIELARASPAPTIISTPAHALLMKRHLRQKRQNVRQLMEQNRLFRFMEGNEPTNVAKN